MSIELVVEWRTNALYNKFLKKLSTNPLWMKQLFQDNPELIDILIKCVQGQMGWQSLAERIQLKIREEAEVKAAAEVATGSMTIERIQDTLEN